MIARTDYWSAYFPAYWRVFGVRLEPFCLGHAMLLQAYGSPFAVERNEHEKLHVRLADVLFALWVCSRDFHEAARRIGRRLDLRWRCLSWRIKMLLWARPTLFAERASMLARYIEESQAMPDLFVRTNGRPAGTPYLLSLKLFLMGDLGLSESAALAMPLQQAIWECCAWQERHGRLEIANDSEAQWLREMRERDDRPLSA